MKCVRCNVENSHSADYCQGCKAPLRFRRRSERYRQRKIWITGIILGVWGICFAYYFRHILFDLEPAASVSAVQRKKVATRDAAKRRQLLERLQNRAKLNSAVSEKQTVSGQNSELAVQPLLKNISESREIISGTLTINDPWGHQVAVLRGAVFAGGWIALPTRACLAGTKWLFNGDSVGNSLVVGGSWNEGATVGIWQVAASFKQKELVELSPWDSSSPVKWLSLESLREAEAIMLVAKGKDGDFIRTSVPNKLNEIGVLLQDGNIVGWTFGQWLTEAYLWGDKSGAPLQAEVSVDDFYKSTFAGGGEEMFAMALGGDYTPMERLDLILEGYRLPERLTLEETPYNLLPEYVVKQLRVLVQMAIDSGKEELIVRKLDSAALKMIGDITLFMDILDSVIRVKGYEAAIAEIEFAGAAIVQGMGIDVPGLNEKHLALYQDWLQTLISGEDLSEGERVYAKVSSYYANDPYVFLLGVELEILKGNWQEAERLLYQRNYPPELLDRFEVLARKISDLKGQEGNIVVRFTPGANRIPLTASLNGSSGQDFLLDTGASMFTIPSSTVDELGLEIVSGDHYGSRRVSTAGGVVIAEEVILDSIEIGGWVEYNVKALVLDIPDQPGLGLVGLNYLNRFKIDLNSDEGVLVLTPK